MELKGLSDAPGSTLRSFLANCAEGGGKRSLVAWSYAEQRRGVAQEGGARSVGFGAGAGAMVAFRT